MQRAKPVEAVRDAARSYLMCQKQRRSGIADELLTFAEADHAFFNDTGARFNAHAAAESWRRALNWFDAAADRRDD
jgi:carboxymethylenebutenolidase